MYKDESIEEVRNTRHQISAEYGHNTKRLLDHYKELEKKYKDRTLLKCKSEDGERGVSP
jgi:hypothetical protein